MSWGVRRGRRRVRGSGLSSGLLEVIWRFWGARGWRFFRRGVVVVSRMAGGSRWDRRRRDESRA